MTATLTTPAEVLEAVDRARKESNDPAKALAPIHEFGRAQYLDGYDRAKQTNPVRTMFALRAPNEVPLWFEPNVHHRKPQLAPIPAGWNEKHDEQLATMLKLPDETLARIARATPADVGTVAAARAIVIRRYETLVESYNRACREEAIAQWPWWWADRILAADGTPHLATVGEVMRILEPRIVFSGPEGDPRREPTAVLPLAQMMEPGPGALIHCTHEGCKFVGTAEQYKPSGATDFMVCPLCGTSQARPTT